MITVVNNDIFSTHRALEFFERYKCSFGNVKKAELSGKLSESLLKLTNSEGEIMEFRGCFTGGYVGEGPRGIYSVLCSCGFNVTKEFIFENSSFNLTR